MNRRIFIGRFDEKLEHLFRIQKPVWKFERSYFAVLAVGGKCFSIFVVQVQDDNMRIGKHSDFLQKSGDRIRFACAARTEYGDMFAEETVGIDERAFVFNERKPSDGKIVM